MRAFSRLSHKYHSPRKISYYSLAKKKKGYANEKEEDIPEDIRATLDVLRISF